jgi:hypothetical protein
VRILVITYFFPPFKRVGGRRWAKHLKYFRRSNIDFSVLAGAFKDTGSPWNSDIVEYNDRITRVPTFEPWRPYFMKSLPKTILQKLRWKASYWSWFFFRRLKAGNYTDDSIKSTNLFYKSAKQLISKEKATIVILSVGPFHYGRIIRKLKNIFPEVKFIVDYRDFLEESFERLTPRQKQRELREQLSLLSSADAVLTADVTITEHLSILTNKPLYTLPHAVDTDYLQISEQTRFESNNNTHSFIYGGLLYSGLEDQIGIFCEFFKAFSKISKRKCLTDFYVYSAAYENLLNIEGVRIHSAINSQLFRDIVIESDYILLFESSLSMASFFTSKFYEILCFRKPILFFGRKGNVSEFLLKYKLGFHITNENYIDQAEYLLSESNNLINVKYPVENHSFQKITSDLIDFVTIISQSSKNIEH